MLREGATTVWERWEYLTGAGMNSHNHVMFGSVDAWFYKTLAGINIDPAHPGFKKVIIKPYLPNYLSHVSAAITTIRGRVASSRRKEKNALVLSLTLPVNTEGRIYIPTTGITNPIVREGDHTVFQDGSFTGGVEGVTSGKLENGGIVFEVGSGSYSFSVSESSPV